MVDRLLFVASIRNWFVRSKINQSVRVRMGVQIRVALRAEMANLWQDGWWHVQR